MSPCEKKYFGLLERAESGAEGAARDWAKTAELQQFLRGLASVLAKRSVGVRLGHHRHEDVLKEYESVLRDDTRLDELADRLRRLLNESAVRFNALETFGQSEPSSERIVTLAGGSVSVSGVIPAPGSTEGRPAHDLPFIIVTEHVVPLTLELYVALGLRTAGVPRGGLPASVRAAIDRILQLHAGRLCHDDRLFRSHDAEYELGGFGRLALSSTSSTPTFRAGRPATGDN